MSALKDLLHQSDVSLARREGPVKVVVDLETSQPQEGCIERLGRLGLEVKEIIQNKIVGSIDAQRLTSLRNDADVREVEIGIPLKPHQR